MSYNQFKLSEIRLRTDTVNFLRTCKRAEHFNRTLGLGYDVYFAYFCLEPTRILNDYVQATEEWHLGSVMRRACAIDIMRNLNQN